MTGRASTKVWRWIEAAVQGRLSSSRRGALWGRLRSDAQARSDYDRVFDVMRALEQRPLAEAEYGLVEDWLLADVEPETATVASSWWSWRWLGVACAVTAGLVLAVGPLQPRVQDDGWQARGSQGAHGLAIDALCPTRTGEGLERNGLVPAAEAGCSGQSTLSFAYRIDPSSPAVGVLSLFGVDERGDVLYYAPTPADTAAIDTVVGTWQPLPLVVNLNVNHEPGRIVLYGLVSAEPPTREQIDAVARALDETPPVRMGDPPWHRRLLGRDVMDELCGTPSTCESAELKFEIYEDLQ